MLLAGVAGADVPDFENGEALLSLSHPRPNPTAASSISVSFATDRVRRVDVAIFDLAGREVTRLGSDRTWTAGAHEVRLDLPGIKNGVYFVALLENDALGSGYRVLGARRLIVRR